MESPAGGRLLEAFLESLRLDRGASAHTLAAYRSDLLQWAEALGESKRSPPFAAPPTPDEVEHAKTVLHQRGLEARSLARKTSALRQFFKFLATEHGWPAELALSLQVPRAQAALPQTLSAAEITQLLDAAAESSPRDRAMVFTLYASGLRVSELVGLAVGDVDLELSSVRVTGKGGKQRLVPLAKPACEAIEVYLQEQRPALRPLDDALFVNQRGGARLTRQAFWQILKELGVRAGIAHPFSPHTLRHAFATHLLQGGMGLRSLQMLLGHASIATTEIYTHVENRTLQEAHRQFHPRGGKLK